MNIPRLHQLVDLAGVIIMYETAILKPQDYHGNISDFKNQIMEGFAVLDLKLPDLLRENTADLYKFLYIKFPEEARYIHLGKLITLLSIYKSSTTNSGIELVYDAINVELEKSIDKSKANEIVNILKELDKFETINYLHKLVNNQLMIKDKSKNIYFSYAWGDKNEIGNSREEIINKLYNTLLERQYSLKRDKMDLGYKGLISEFMLEIGKGSLIIIAISDKYLKSSYCMFELYEIYRNNKLDKKEFSQRIFPIHIEYINLNDPLKLDEYYSFWEEKEKAWNNLIQRRMDKIGKEQFAEYDKVKQISWKFGDLASFIMDMNALTPEMLSENSFQKMIEAIDYKLNND